MEIENFLESKREVFIRESLMSDAFLDFVERNTDPFDRLMASNPLTVSFGRYGTSKFP